MKTSAKLFFAGLFVLSALLVSRMFFGSGDKVVDRPPEATAAPTVPAARMVTAVPTENRAPAVPPPSTGARVPTFEDIPLLPGVKEIRLAHWTWNTHQAWALANKGKMTAADSLFAQRGVSLKFKRIEEIPLQIAELRAFAAELKSGNPAPRTGAHFFTIMGDAGGWVLNDTNKALRAVDPGYSAEIIGFGGFSAGEDKFLGPPRWKENPQSARGGLVAGVPADGDWNVMIFWCAQNRVPFNSDETQFDPEALNFMKTASFLEAADTLIAGREVERVFTADGKDSRGQLVRKGSKGRIAVNGAVTWTPGDKNIANKRGGVVSIASTREYSNQMPQYIVGLKQWDEQNKQVITSMLAALFQAADEINEADEKLKSGAMPAKSAADRRWDAARYAHEIFDSETPDYWYRYFDVVTVTDTMGLKVEIGGSSVSNLPRNLAYFGLDGSVDIGEVVYNRFATLAMSYYPAFMDAYPEWRAVFNPEYLLATQKAFPALTAAQGYLPQFTASAEKGTQLGELSYSISFESGKALFTPAATAVLEEALEQLVIAANARVEIHGHTDSQGNDDANLVLSQRRGEAVAAWLKTRAGTSFPENRATVVAHGEQELAVADYDPATGAHTAEKMAVNRRVVLKIFRREGQATE
ncbi:MAG: OmpA family protein [Candidatus Schekmanbacteria bacterium]|nr:OmpA family protein [Candidatus Schekmanbacteria bacterium]